MYYIIFLRIIGMDEMSAEGLATSVNYLSEIVQSKTTDREISLSSVYGRIILVPESVKRALQLSELLLDQATAVGVPLSIGIAVGTTEKTQDLLHENHAGTTINRSARLAHLKGGAGRIAVDERVARDAIAGTEVFNADSFSEPLQEMVKRTALHCRWLKRTAVQKGELAITASADSRIAHVVVYDIARFSENVDAELVRLVEELGHSARRALQAAGVPDAQGFIESKNHWYAPAGDGGVVVFGGAYYRAAWTFAQALLKHASERRVPIRVGISTGQIVVTPGNLPVGTAILEADRLSGKPQDGGICAGARFWSESLSGPDRDLWQAIPVDGEPEGLLLVHPMKACT